MRIIAKKTLRDFWIKNKDARQPLVVWYSEAKKENWKNFNDVEYFSKSASIVGNDRVVFNIKGNNYRLVVKIDFEWQVIYIKFVGTHKEYDKIDVKNI
ncbi:MAG: type II toxin-antitoxin system HigB family toxin [Ignavibacteria bacterium]|nr:type II toxin-antitoxin system HigB family toxin [Ignavibacteria bacterium]